MHSHALRYPSVGLLALLVAVAAVLILVAFSSAPQAEAGPYGKIPGQYIVVFKDNVSDPDTVSDQIAAKHGFAVSHKYRHALKGFASAMSDEKLERVKNDPRVAFVSEDRVVSIDAQTLPTGIDRINAEPAFLPNTNTGAGIGVAIIDTGIDLKHPDLQVAAGKNCVRGGNYNDGNGHGTHVAGTVAARDNTIGVVGVAPRATLLAVRVLNNGGFGSWSTVICGIDWVTTNAAKYNIKVANMSLGGAGAGDNNCGNTNNDALHKAICKSRDAGVTYVVAAGNSATTTASFVPAAYDDAVITVSALADSDGVGGGTGSTTSYGPDDTFATFSNYGAAVDIAAPGVSILSTWKGGAYNTLSGTSMATPHVAGAAALYLYTNPGASWIAVRDALKSLGEPLGLGHTDPSGLHPEPVLRADTL